MGHITVLKFGLYDAIVMEFSRKDGMDVFSSGFITRLVQNLLNTLEMPNGLMIWDVAYLISLSINFLRKAYLTCPILTGNGLSNCAH